MGDTCSNCGEDFGFEVGWDEPDVGDAILQAKWNPQDDMLVDEVTGNYCSIECLEEDAPDWVIDQITRT